LYHLCPGKQRSAMEAKKEQWKVIQAQLRSTLKKYDSFPVPVGSLRYAGGVDISFVKDSDVAVAAFVVVELPSMQVKYSIFEKCIMTEPYIPGFLAFREVDHLEKLISKFKAEKPEMAKEVIVLVDGNGILHYRGFGLASHLGVVADIPTIGVGKELLCVDGMESEKVIPKCKESLTVFGDYADLVGPNTGRIHGAAVCTSDNEKHLFVSIGHRISLGSAVALVLKCCKRGQWLPEPIKLADGLSREIIAKAPSLEDTNFEDISGMISMGLPITFSSASKKKKMKRWVCVCGAENYPQNKQCAFCKHKIILQ